MMSNSQNKQFTLIYQTQSDQYFICLYTPIIKKYMHQNNKTAIRRIRRRIRRRRRRRRGRRLNQALYYLDFCWCMNFTGMLFIGMLLLAGQNVDDATRRALFSALLGISCGPLTGANIVLPFVSCLFHDVNTMTGLFIHLMPSMVVYTFMWHTTDILRCWPNIFHLTYMDAIEFFPTTTTATLNVLGGGSNSVVGNAIGLYLS
ncbi:hypothetical protein ACHAWU_004208 [Discostella pseudostelligera]|uniref:Glycerophosphocholine acyltransferase 1 n=1 Tax=Discostella pseudostelligera TaxID=259834 RepID=A0ABD3M387_9STRA